MRKEVEMRKEVTGANIEEERRKAIKKDANKFFF